MASLRIFAAAALLAWAAPAAADPIDRWAQQIAEASSRFDIPAGWIRRVMRAESGGQTMRGGAPIVSRAGALGLMLMMPGTWSDMRLARGLGPDPHDPRDNILAGAAYLRLMYDRFGYPGLFAAYNAGPARYAGFLTGGRLLPTETRAYAAAIAPAKWQPFTIAAKARGDLFALRASARPEAQASSPPLAPGGLFVALREAPPR